MNNLHRWKTFKPEFQVKTIQSQANVDHCGVCELPPLGKKAPPSIVKNTPKKKYGLLKNLGGFCVLLGGFYTLHILYHDNLKRKKHIDI